VIYSYAKLEGENDNMTLKKAFGIVCLVLGIPSAALSALGLAYINANWNIWLNNGNMTSEQIATQTAGFALGLVVSLLVTGIGIYLVK
jgi:hypothetical protein